MIEKDIVDLLDSSNSKAFNVEEVVEALQIPWRTASTYLPKLVKEGKIKRVSRGSYASLSYAGSVTDAAPFKQVVKRGRPKKAAKKPVSKYKLVAINKTYELTPEQLVSKLGLKGRLVDVSLAFETNQAIVEKIRIQLSETLEEIGPGQTKELEQAAELNEEVEEEEV